MRYGIVINLAYESHPYRTLKALFMVIRDEMLQAGFRLDGRVFTIDLPEGEARDLARRVIEGVDQREGTELGQIYQFIKEFYGFQFSEAVNLLVPSTDDIGVVEFDAETLEAIGKDTLMDSGPEDGR